MEEGPGALENVDDAVETVDEREDISSQSRSEREAVDVYEETELTEDCLGRSPLEREDDPLAEDGAIIIPYMLLEG